MKRLSLIGLLGVLGLLVLIGCASTGSARKDGPCQPVFAPLPAPQPGLVLVVNQSSGVWADCWLFEGRFSEKKLILPHPTQRGKMVFAKTPLKNFRINPPFSRPYRGNVVSSAIVVSLTLPTYQAPYTLLVFHRNFLGDIVRIETRRFSTTGYGLNKYHLIGGRRVYADRVIKLARLKPYGRTRLRIDRTFYPGHTLLNALGLQ